MSTLRIGSLCSGYGGLDLAVIAALGAGRVAWHAQYEPPDKNGKPDMHQWAAQILAERFPGVPNHGDITAIDFRSVEPVDVLTAGFPCTDISLAGDGAGIAPGTRSGIWTYVASAVALLRPRIVFIENVRSLTSATAHCELEPCPWCVGDHHQGPVLRALGAVLGDLADLGFDAEWISLPASGVGAPHERFRTFVAAWPADAVPDADHVGPHRAGACRARWAEPAHGGDAVADPARFGRREGWSESARQPGRSGAVGGGGAAATQWGDYEPAIRRWESVTGRPAPMPTSPQGRLDPVFVEWMMGLPAGWVTVVPEIPRAAQLKALGNDVQQGAAAFRALISRAEPLRHIAANLVAEPARLLEVA
ncbi:DNA cytosine methyltransferase [Catenulispora sp. NF23]|uniref:DNA cytosine methyltransferase n=1 Tax=Catenulispora pinistramenti TaxID=2705254 RepID=UPI001BA7D22C|nr:DNA cytosine methyltransferase [Catenulispora pinistramenti]MBS2534153.1 DNA cytosine methyltransferase [Catenulispora pinistramenti]